MLTITLRLVISIDRFKGNEKKLKLTRRVYIHSLFLKQLKSNREPPECLRFLNLGRENKIEIKTKF